jgi:hypothetical protein
MMPDFLTVLAAGGDAATVIFAFLIWKLDRRLLALEISLIKEHEHG